MNVLKVAVGACLAILIGWAAPALAQTPVKIGIITSLSGPGGYLGQDIRDGFELAIDMGGGKLGGVPVQVVVEDDGAKPGQGKQIADRFLLALTRLAGDRILVSTASEEEWFDNIVELGWQLYLCSSPPYLLQSATDRRMRTYTDLAFGGRIEEARAVRDSLNPVRAALRGTRPPEKPHAHQKYWQELLGQVGGRVRAPLLELTEEERTATRRAFEACGLQAGLQTGLVRKAV